MAERDAKKETTDTSRPSDEEKVEMPEPTPPNSVVLNISNPSFETLASGVGLATGSPTPEAEEKKKEEKEGKEEEEKKANEVHAVIRMVQDRDLGKTVLTFAVPIAMAIVFSGQHKLDESQTSIILILLCVGFTAIVYGIAFKETYPIFAQIAETGGIALIATAFFAIVAFFLPPEISWVPLVCIALCLVPFCLAVLQPPPN